MIQSEFQKLQREQHEKAQRQVVEKRIEETTKQLAALYDKAAAYTNLILAAGYAGFFAVWSLVKSDLSRFEVCVSALCISFSLVVFVFWEVLVVLYVSRNLGNINKALQAPLQDFEKELEKAKVLESKRAIFIRRFWYVVLLLTIVPRLIGGAILMGSFIRQLLAMV